MTPETIDLLSKIGTVTGLLFILIGGYRGFWVWGWQYRAMQEQKDAEIARHQKDADFWRDYSLDLLKVADGATQVAQRATGSR